MSLIGPQGMEHPAGASRRILAVVGRGPRPHRLLAGDDATGGWCGAGDAGPVVSAGAGGVGGEPVEDRAVEGGADLDSSLAAVLADLATRTDAAGVRSVLLAVLRGGRPVEVWIGLGPPQAAVLVRCWPGVAHGPEGTGEPAHTAPLAAAAEAAAVALADGRLERAAFDAAVAPARREAFAEGRLAERQAALMEAGGDVAGAQVRRALAQLHAVHLALTALRGAGADGGA